MRRSSAVPSVRVGRWTQASSSGLVQTRCQHPGLRESIFVSMQADLRGRISQISQLSQNHTRHYGLIRQNLADSFWNDCIVLKTGILSVVTLLCASSSKLTKNQAAAADVPERGAGASLILLLPRPTTPRSCTAPLLGRAVLLLVAPGACREEGPASFCAAGPTVPASCINAACTHSAPRCGQPDFQSSFLP